MFFGVVVGLMYFQYVFGVVFFGVSVIRAGVFARGAGVLLIVGIIVENVAGIARVSLLHGTADGSFVVFAALAWLGAQLAVGEPGEPAHP